MAERLKPRPAAAPPRDETELLARATAIAGCTLADIAYRHAQPVPADLSSNKGWVGQLLEQHLGADAASLSEPDFRELGIELKSLPFHRDGRARESTFVCNVPMQHSVGIDWHDSCVYRKLQRVLWIPIEAGAGLALEQRRVGMPLLWSPDAEQEDTLRRDWEEHMEHICLGQWDRLVATLGTWLQVRPKAQNARTLCPATGADGATDWALPRGFYLRASFTTTLLRAHYAIASQRD